MLTHVPISERALLLGVDALDFLNRSTTPCLAPTGSNGLKNADRLLGVDAFGTRFAVNPDTLTAIVPAA